MHTIKFANGRIRLWNGIAKKQGTMGIGIRFDKKVPQEEALQIHDSIRKILILKYGEGVGSEPNT